jgi:hypothetical protein
MYVLKNWSVSYRTDDPWVAPECNPKCLKGNRYGNGEEGRGVLTSAIVKIDGKKITTFSGSVYILEEPDPNYLQWMKKEGYNFDPENPIKDKRTNK